MFGECMLDPYNANKKAFQSNANFPLSNSPWFMVDKFRVQALHMGVRAGVVSKGELGLGPCLERGQIEWN